MLIEINGNESKLPDFIIVGAQKSGTTSLYHYLRQHPKISIPYKEPFFFCSSDMNKESLENRGNRGSAGVIRELKDYVKLFEPVDEGQLIGEASTDYLYRYDTTIRNIKAVYRDRAKDIRIIIILRNPVDRAFSHYMFNVRDNLETLTFEDAIDPDVRRNNMVRRSFNCHYVEYGMYYNQVKAYIENFPETRIYLLEELRSPDTLLRDVFEFLGVDADIKIDTDFQTDPSGIPKSRFMVDLILRMTRGNPLKEIVPEKIRTTLIIARDRLLKKLVVKPRMNDATRRRLIEFYRDEIIALQHLIDKDLSHWLTV